MDYDEIIVDLVQVTDYIGIACGRGDVPFYFGRACEYFHKRTGSRRYPRINGGIDLQETVRSEDAPRDGPEHYAE